MKLRANNIQSLCLKTASTLALFLGVMSVFAGGKVLLQIDSKDYNVLYWLVVYNVIFGAISIVVAYLIWKRISKFTYAVWFVFFSHFFLSIYLLFFNSEVASESIKAMLFRVITWVIIVALSVIIPFKLSKKL